MTIDLNDEILQDFLVEAGEILELLDEQLVDLEQTPDNGDLLNAIFRGFHTIKGGASFLALTNLVGVCHIAEDVFNLLRNREIELSAHMMDTFLRVLDEVNTMFAQIREGTDPEAAPPELIQKLVAMQNPASDTDTVEALPGVAVEKSDPDNDDGGSVDLMDSMFEKVTASETGSDVEPEISANDDSITDDEFESLLDSLQGQNGNGDSQTGNVTPVVAQKPGATPGDDEITDTEFEDLLDHMHGKGKGPAGSTNADATNRVNQPVSKPREFTVAKSDSSSTNSKQASPKMTAEATVRVDTTRLDQIMNLVGELVLARNRLNTLKETFEDSRVHQAIANLDVVTGDLQTAIMKTRMQPVKKVFGRFPRVVRDLARTLGKEVELEMVGEDTDLDKNLVEALADPLIHLVRNSVDHGIESPAQRKAAGKSDVGKVVLTAKQEGDCILLSISDDGAGMDPEILRQKAIDSGMLDAETAMRLDDKGCFDLIFMPGLTTKQDISNVSGRGVGMDVVKTTITQLNGSIEIDSVIGEGTLLQIRVPLTLAILPTLMVQLGSRKYALPLSSVSEIFELSSKQINIVDGHEVVINRGKAPQIFYLRKWLLNGSADTEPGSDESQVIMVQAGSHGVGLVVDRVIGQEEVVIKPLDKLLQGLPGMAGSTITGDGNIAIILDVQGLLHHYAQ